MRINTHAHIFNLRSVFTPETAQILLRRLKLEKVPEQVIEVLYKKINAYLRKEIDSESIFNMLDERLGATDEFSELFGKLGNKNIKFDLQIDGALAKIGDAAQSYLREKILELYDLDKNGEIRQNWFDYVEYLRVALMPTIEKVTDEVMGQMGKEDALVALAMDITDGADNGTLYLQQLKDMSDVLLAYPGRLFPYVMVNPARDGYLGIMKNAIEKMGFWGVKLYPSLGYEVHSEKMLPVYRYCVDNNIPILTHCTIKGFRRDKESGELASPKKWDKVFQEFPDLKVCFGHFGADNTIVQGPISKESWPGMIIELINKYPNVYTDISFHTDAMIGNDDVDKTTARQNYAKNVKSLLNSAQLKQRILFGTDYWMVRTVTKDSDYWGFYKKMFTAIQFDRLTKTNPTEYLGLPGATNPSETLINHHLNYFKTKKLKVQREPAKWLKESLKAAVGVSNEFVVMGTAPTWDRNNWIHYFLYEYLIGGKIFREADIQDNLQFEEYGRFKLANLRYWDTIPEPQIFDTTVQGIASNIIKVVVKRNKKWVSYNNNNGVTEKKARRELIAALKNPDWYVYQLAELCSSLFVFKHPEMEGENDE
jgi:predicted TIM-barrel fold metal-dependent hydrolase